MAYLTKIFIFVTWIWFIFKCDTENCDFKEAAFATHDPETLCF